MPRSHDLREPLTWDQAADPELQVRRNRVAGALMLCVACLGLGFLIGQLSSPLFGKYPPGKPAEVVLARESAAPIKSIEPAVGISDPASRAAQPQWASQSPPAQHAKPGEDEAAGRKAAPPPVTLINPGTSEPSAVDSKRSRVDDSPRPNNPESELRAKRRVSGDLDHYPRPGSRGLSDYRSLREDLLGR